MKKIFAILFFTCLMTISGLAVDFKISVNVQAENEQIEQSVKKHLVQELSSIKDVQVVEKGNWNMRVMVVKHKLKDSKNFTYSLSAVISSQANCSVIDGQAKVVSTKACDRFEDFATYMGGEDNLVTMSKEFVNDFNTGILEFMREPHLSDLAEKAVD